MSIVALGQIDDIFDRGVRRSLPATVSICTEVRRLVQRSRSLEAALQQPLTIGRQCLAFGRVFAEEGLVAELFGRLEVEVHDGGVALAIPSLKFSEASAEAAIKWFRQQRLMKEKELGWMRVAFRQKGRIIGKDLQSYVQGQLNATLRKALEKGWTRRGFLRKTNAIFDSWGITRPAKHHLETIYQTAGRMAYQHGRYMQQRKPAALERRPYWKYRTMGDSRVRPHHAGMESRIYPADDPIWDTWYPPNGFNCRCYVTTLTEAEVDEISAQPEGLFPDPGFDQSPADFLR